MPTPPDLTAVKAYLGPASGYTDEAVNSALTAETAAQAKACRLPADADPDDPGPYPADLGEALCRRVAHNLALRPIPLGVTASFADGAVATNRVGGTDAEVARLERPYLKMPIR